MASLGILFRLVLLVTLLPLAAFSAPPSDAIPDLLATWSAWVLRDADWRDCPLAPASGDQRSAAARDGAGRLCSWPGELVLDVNDRGGQFRQFWNLYAPGPLPLPGDARAWPQQVRVNGGEQPILSDQGRPVLRLEAGAYEVTGAFVWSRLPEGLHLPPIRGPVRLRLNGRDLEAPRSDGDGQLWLSTAPGRQQAAQSREAAAGDAVTLTVTRLIADGVPVRVTTRLELDVSGQPRQLTLVGSVLAGTLPLRIDSPLPARLDASGQLQLQLQPGHWVVQVQARFPGRPTLFALGGAAPPWPDREVWAFRADPELRQVEVGGAPAVDPRQTRLPPEWLELPAYGLEAGDELSLRELPFSPAAAERLRLSRELWLDFSGRGYSVRDQIQGELAGVTRLDALAPLQLGQVRVDGEPRLITHLGPEGAAAAAGVEVRGDRTEVSADGRFNDLRDRVPASGWAMAFEGIQTTLHLPPGWDLLAVSGADNLPPSWLARWSLLDLFLVLIAALATGRLWGWRWGLFALITLAMIWQEPAAPRTLWLHLLGAAALLRLLPATGADGGESQPRALRMTRSLIAVYLRAAVLILVVVAAPFLVQQMRDGLYPQLSIGAGSGHAMAGSGRTAVMSKAQSAGDGAAEPEVAMEPQRRALAPASAVLGYRVGANAPMSKSSLPDWAAAPPGAVLQTGVGIPDWNWNAFELEWNGPVAINHRFHLWLLPPVVALILACLQLVLVPVLALRVLGWWPRSAAPADAQAASSSSKSQGAAAVVGGFSLLLVTALCIPWTPALAAPAATPSQPAPAAGANDLPVAGFPPAALLEELRDHLLTPPECLPDCIDLTQLHLQVHDGQLHLRLAVALGAAGAVPLPGGGGLWSPDALLLDGEPLRLMRQQADGSLLAPAPKGVHRLDLTGPLAGHERIELPLPLMPRLVTAELDSPWQLQGLRPDGQAGTQLRLVRVAETGSAAGSDAPDATRASPINALAPLLRLDRWFHLGLTWELHSQVERLSPADIPVTLWLPLLPGEAVTSADAQVVDGRLLLSLPPGQTRLEWTSHLIPAEHLALRASVDPRLVERWCIGVSPFWHVATTGIPSLSEACAPLQGSATGLVATRQWLPWPDETLELAFSRPMPMPGPTLTLDQSRYELTPGLRATDAQLFLELRASEGQQHRIGLPAGAERLDVRIDGQRRALSLQDGALDLPLVPGAQRVELRWQQPGGQIAGYRPAPADVGLDSVNATTELHLSAGRWVLWVQGAGVGPAVLFWSQLVVLGLIAWWLGRLRLTPLAWFDWLLLGIGLSQADIWVSLLVAGWLLALGWRRRQDAPRLEAMPAWRFDGMQVALVLWTLIALVGLLGAIQQGLLGQPRMQIAGNGSTASDLRWYLDHAGHELGQVLVVSAPMLVYRLMMLAWALWLALRLLDWLRWGWRALAQPLAWRPLQWGRQKPNGTRRDASRSTKQEELSVDL